MKIGIVKENAGLLFMRSGKDKLGYRKEDIKEIDIDEMLLQYWKVRNDVRQDDADVYRYASFSEYLQEVLNGK